MIKKLFFLLLIVFSVYGIYTTYSAGYEANLKFAQIDIPSFKEVSDNRAKLDADVKELEKLNSTGITEATEKVKTERKKFETEKQRYDQLALNASREEIKEANKIEEFLLDYLWIKVGNYAADNGIKFKMTPDYSLKTLTFDITGSYISVINFIYDIENDVELGFELEGIIIQGGSSDAIVKAHFIVEDVNVVTAPSEPVEVQ